MSKLPVARALIDYTLAMDRRLWASVLQLGEDEFVADADYSHGSVRNQVVHIASVEGSWLRRLMQTPDAETWELRADDFRTPAEAYRAWKDVSSEWEDYAATLSEELLDAVLPGMGGPRWQVILNVANHGTDHRAQTLRLLHDLGAPTFEQELEDYLWSRPQPVAATRNTC